MRDESSEVSDDGESSQGFVGALNVYQAIGLGISGTNNLQRETIRLLREIGLEIEEEIKSTASFVLITARRRGTSQRIVIKAQRDPHDAHCRQRLEREWRILNAPGFPEELGPCPYLGIGCDSSSSGRAVPDCQPLILMEFIAGPTVHEWLAESGQMDRNEKVSLCERMFRQIQRLHEANIVHGDPSPNNWIVSESARPRLVDFERSGRLNPGFESQTPNNGLPGTTGAAPVEQQTGRVSASKWTDVYTVCRVSLLMLTHPHDLEGSELDQDGAYRAMRAANVPVAPARIISSGLREGIDDPGYPSAGDLAQQLCDWRCRYARWGRRARLAVVLATGVLLPCLVWVASRTAPGDAHPVLQHMVADSQSEISELPYLDHPGVAKVLREAGRYSEEYGDLVARGEVTAAGDKLRQLHEMLSMAIDQNAALEEWMPVHAFSGALLVYEDWEDAESIRSVLAQLRDEHNSISSLIDAGSIGDAQVRLLALLADLSRLIESNTEAKLTAALKARYELLEASLPEGILKLEAFLPTKERARAANDAWNVGEWTEAEHEFGLALEAAERCVEEHATPMERNEIRERGVESVSTLLVEARLLRAALYRLKYDSRVVARDSDATGVHPFAVEPQRRHLNTINMSLTLVPAGSFLMGSTEFELQLLESAVGTADINLSHELPAHAVDLRAPFYIGTHEVTQAQFERVMGRNLSLSPRRSEAPVENVTWYDAVEFCNRLSQIEELPEYYEVLDSESFDGSVHSARVSIAGGVGYRLPTEAEWEYACRAGTRSIWYCGDDPSLLSDIAWWDDLKGQTHVVGEKRPNAFGLYDMCGNVREWCWDYYSSAQYVDSPAADPIGPLLGVRRVVRGGSWECVSPILLRSAYRNGLKPDERFDCVGFRVVRSLIQ